MEKKTILSCFYFRFVKYDTNQLEINHFVKNKLVQISSIVFGLIFMWLISKQFNHYCQKQSFADVYEIGVLKKHQYRSLFFNKVAVLGHQLYLKKDTNTYIFP